jgi:hypothetical protein
MLTGQTKQRHTIYSQHKHTAASRAIACTSNHYTLRCALLQHLSMSARAANAVYLGWPLHNGPTTPMQHCSDS